jgi:hypothetical protein
MSGPDRLTVRTYQVGFGDCFLLSFRYPDGERHVLMDFGSTSLPKDAPKTRMMDVARDIRDRCGKGGLTAVVATHRHKDHISGFDPGTPRRPGPGAIIKALAPRLVVQPWTEDPNLDPQATGPAPTGAAGAQIKQLRALGSMHAVAEMVVRESKRSAFFSNELKATLSFLGDDNIKNLEAVRNLMDMGSAGEARYAYYGSDAGFGPHLPGVKVHVLGPPTVQQSATVKRQRSRDPDEFWHLQSRALRSGAPEPGGKRGAKAPPLFPHDVVHRAPGTFPIDARWFVSQTRKIRGEQLLQVVRMLDQALNNTSLILLFEVNGRILLFPGDAQIENWAYALSKKPVRDKLAKVDVYKVGHHGSLNATPKSLWALFKKKRGNVAAGAELVTLMSTMPGKHGHEEDRTEVPRKSLVSQLQNQTDHFTTESLSGGAFFHDTVLELV